VVHSFENEFHKNQNTILNLLIAVLFKVGITRFCKFTRRVIELNFIHTTNSTRRELSWMNFKQINCLEKWKALIFEALEGSYRKIKHKPYVL